MLVEILSKPLCVEQMAPARRRHGFLYLHSAWEHPAPLTRDAHRELRGRLAEIAQTTDIDQAIRLMNQLGIDRRRLSGETAMEPYCQFIQEHDAMTVMTYISMLPSLWRDRRQEKEQHLWLRCRLDAEFSARSAAAR